MQREAKKFTSPIYLNELSSDKETRENKYLKKSATNSLRREAARLARLREAT